MVEGKVHSGFGTNSCEDLRELGVVSGQSKFGLDLSVIETEGHEHHSEARAPLFTRIFG